jgi:hypothetical protein
MTAINYKQVLEANADNTDLLAALVREVNAWNGALESYEVYDFDDDFFSMFFEGKPVEAARATFFGNIQNWMDEYIRFNGYGNLESLSSYQYDKELLAGADDIISEALGLIDGGSIDVDFELEGLGLA